MKKLAILKTLATLLFVFALIGLFFGVPFILVVAVMPGSVPFEINGAPANTTNVETILMMVALVIGLGFFTYALYLFRKVLTLFEKKKIFHDDVIKNFDQIGKAIIIGYFVMAVPYMLYVLLTENRVDISVEFGLNESILVLGAGLFFIVLSEVFLVAKNIKEENDLTV
jgi:hypothetical protein